MDYPRYCVFVDVPLCAYRPYESREYQDTFPLPPPSAVYGMLLALVGVPREDKARHRGVAMTIAAETLPTRSRVFRKLRRGRDLEDLRPDYQDLLIDLKLWIWLADGHDRATPTLPVRVAEALTSPVSIDRFGGLSLGESAYLVNAIQVGRTPGARLVFWRPSPRGFHHFPTWVDHLNAAGTVRQRFDLQDLDVPEGLSTCEVLIGE